MTDPHTYLLTNARVVLANRVLPQAWVAVADGQIADVGEGRPPETGFDMGGDLVMPGLVELHTDHLEAHYIPRPAVHWDPVAAVLSYDSQLATCGITTVLDSLRIAREERQGEAAECDADILAPAIARARDAGLLRCDHFVHLRCEVPTPTVVEDCARILDGHAVRLISLMDHTPGQRQFRDEEKLRIYYRGKKHGMSEAELDAYFADRRRLHDAHARDNRAGLVRLAKFHGVPLASHDDTTVDHVTEAVEDGIAVAEFPTTLEAAAALNQAGIAVMMGAPNLVRGGSHSGNVAASTLAGAGLLDVFSSDYVPSSLLMAALRLPAAVPGIDLASAVRTVTKTPAEAVGLGDRGEIVPGRRADLIRIYDGAGVPAVRTVWREGRRVA
jgi:alpha-D-ribose 1-methylphosphonate 5-triphosphate diphosphatase